MLLPKRLDYSDCYQGILKLIIENKGLPSYFLNISSWGFNFVDNEEFDIPKFEFNQILGKYYGFKIHSEYWKTADEYISLIKSNLWKADTYVLVKTNVNTCSWHNLAMFSNIYHFLLVTDCTNEGKLKCIDIFYPDEYHEYDIETNADKCRKIAIITNTKASVPDDAEICTDFVSQAEKQLELKPSYSEKMRAFAQSDFLSDVFSCDNQGQYDMYQLSAKRIATARADICEVLKNHIMPGNEDVISQWCDIAKKWHRFSNYLIKNTIVPTRREGLLEKSRVTLNEIADSEELLMRKTIDILKRNDDNKSCNSCKKYIT